MVGSLLWRGMLAGLLAGILTFAFARTFGEPLIERAIAFEEHEAHAHSLGGHEHEDELVSRATQAGAGLATGVIVYGASIGGIFALVFASLYGRLGHLDAKTSSALLALLAFISVSLAPQLKYPANPPAVGSADTIGMRMAFFFIMMALSIAAMCGAVALARRLWRQYGGWNAMLASSAFFVVALLVVGTLLPTVSEVPEGFSADLLWHFRMVSLGIHAILWSVIGIAFGVMAERRLGEQRGGMPVPHVAG